MKTPRSFLVNLLVGVSVLVAVLPLSAQVPSAAPGFTLINQNGDTIRLNQFRGRLVLLNFIYTHCVDICPITTAKLAQIQTELKKRGWFGTKVILLSVTFDPRRDTPGILKEYAKKFKVDHAGWHFLSGEPNTVLRAVRAYKIPFRPASRPGLIDHALPTLVIDRRGRILGHYEPDFDPQDVLRDLAHLLGS
jgi:protein SCO1/2